MRNAKVYLDLIFLENILIDYVLLCVVKHMLHMPTKKCRLLLGALLGAAATTEYYMFPIQTGWILLIQLLLAVGMIYSSFGSVRKQKLICAVALLYCLSFLMEGMLRLMIRQTGISRHTIYTLCMLCGTILFGGLFLERLLKMVAKQNSVTDQIFKVSIRTQGRCFSGTGFMDSGNCLKEPITGSAVVVVEKEFLKRNGVSEPETGYFAIPFRALGCEAGILKGFFIDEMILEQNEKRFSYEKVMLGIYDGRLCSQNTYQMLLNPAL